MKKASKKGRKKRAAVKTDEDNQPKSTKDDATDNALDFGGLPARNLKKNLGCG